MHNPLYIKYLQSTEWKNKAIECKRLANNKCSKCDSIINLHAHHLTYDRIGEEHQADLQCLCQICHEKEHDKVFVKRIKEGFNLMYHKTYEEVQEVVLKSNRDIKVFHWVTNKFTYKISETSLLLNDCPVDISQPMFSKLIARLISANYLLRISKSNYRLNPFIYLPYRAHGAELQREWKELTENKDLRNGK